MLVLTETGPVTPFTAVPNPIITPEENDRRFRECLQLIRNVTHDQLVAVMGEDFLEEFKRVSQRDKPFC